MKTIFEATLVAIVSGTNLKHNSYAAFDMNNIGAMMGVQFD